MAGSSVESTAQAGSQESQGIRIGAGINDPAVFSDYRRRRRLIDQIQSVGLDFLSTGDHISFHGGTGFDGLISAATMLATSPTLQMQVGVYLLGLRHPTVTARALATLAELAPGRMTLGVGAGGEDRREVFNAGVDPSSRGRRLDEALHIVSRLLRGETLTWHGEFFELDQAQVLPAPVPQIPLLIGGKGEVAIARTSRFGDGWLAIFCSARRFGSTVVDIRERLARDGRDPSVRMGFTSWVGLDRNPDVARNHLAGQMEQLYRLPYEKFQRVTAAGRPEDVAAFLEPYAQAGATEFTLLPAAETVEAGIDFLGEVTALLKASWLATP